MSKMIIGPVNGGDNHREYRKNRELQVIIFGENNILRITNKRFLRSAGHASQRNHKPFTIRDSVGTDPTGTTGKTEDEVGKCSKI